MGGALFHGGSEPKDMPGHGKASGKGSARSLRDWVQQACEEACGPLEKQLATGSAVDEHLCDQLLAAELSLHARTAIHIAELLVPGVRFKEQKRAGGLSLIEVDGIGHQVGAAVPCNAVAEAAEAAEPVAPTPTVAAVVSPTEEFLRLKQGSLSKAPPAMLADFRNDLGHLSEATGAEVVPDLAGDRMVIRGHKEQRQAA